jgi:hypothetical protein
MSDRGVTSADLANQWLARGHEALVAELRTVLDIETGIRDALLPTAHLAFAASLSAALDIESGLAAALPDESEATPPASTPPGDADPFFPPTHPTSFMPSADEYDDPEPPPRVRRIRPEPERREQKRRWAPPPSDDEDYKDI